MTQTPADPYDMEVVDGIILLNLPRLVPGDSMTLQVQLTRIPPPPYATRMRATLLLGYDVVATSLEARPTLEQQTSFRFEFPDGLRAYRYCVAFVAISDDGTSERDADYTPDAAVWSPHRINTGTREAAVIRAACQNVQRRLGT